MGKRVLEIQASLEKSGPMNFRTGSFVLPKLTIPQRNIGPTLKGTWSSSNPCAGSMFAGGYSKKQSVANRKQHPLPTYHCHALCSLVRGQEYGKCACFSTIFFDVRPIAVRYLCLPGRSQKGQPTFGLPQSWSKFQPRAQNKKVRPELGTPTSVARISLLDIPFRLERTQKENRCSGGPNPKQRLRAIQMSVFLAFLRGPPNILVFPQGVLSTPPPKHWGSSKKKRLASGPRAQDSTAPGSIGGFGSPWAPLGGRCGARGDPRRVSAAPPSKRVVVRAFSGEGWVLGWVGWRVERVAGVRLLFFFSGKPEGTRDCRIGSILRLIT